MYVRVVIYLLFTSRTYLSGLQCGAVFNIPPPSGLTAVDKYGNFPASDQEQCCIQPVFRGPWTSPIEFIF